MEEKKEDIMKSMFIASADGEKHKSLARFKMLNEYAIKGGILFTGSSLMEQFPIGEFLLNEGIPAIAYNRGIGGMKTTDMLEHMEEMVLGTEPSLIFINIGTNDIGENNYNQEILIQNYAKIIDHIHERLGRITIYMMAFYPVNTSEEVVAEAPTWVKKSLQTRTNENIEKANLAVKKLAAEKGCIYIDANDGLKDEYGNLKAEFTIEGIHMYPNAYKIVFNNLKSYLKYEVVNKNILHFPRHK